MTTSEPKNISSLNSKQIISLSVSFQWWNLSEAFCRHGCHESRYGWSSHCVFCYRDGSSFETPHQYHRSVHCPRHCPLQPLEHKLTSCFLFQVWHHSVKTCLVEKQTNRVMLSVPKMAKPFRYSPLAHIVPVCTQRPCIIV